MKPSSSMPQQALFTVPPKWAGKRLDVFLASELSAFSRNQVQSLIADGNVATQGSLKPVKASQIVLEGQTFQVIIPPSKETDLEAQARPLDIIYEDRDMLVINKPVGLVVHPGAGNPDQTLMNALVSHCPGIAGVGGVQRPGLVHRLDKDTSGLLAVAKTDLAYKSLVRQLRGRKMGREYLGLVKGSLEGKGTVKAAIGRHPGARKKMAVRPEGGKPAVTHFQVLDGNETASLLHLKLETGRTHQIRVHMAFIHHPILGDGVYGGESDLAGRQMLHAFRLTLLHPKTGLTKTFTAPLPDDFLACLKKTGLGPIRPDKVFWE
jgi:23S rRNA pseudouridine1911/1915/1917 synthase